MAHSHLLFPAIQNIPFPQIKMLLKEIEVEIKKKISLEDWQKL
jgi:hypothetical protein